MRRVEDGVVTDETERLLVRIGQMLAEDAEYPLDHTLLHAEVDPEMIGPSIFKNAGDHVVYRNLDLQRWSDVLLDLWHAQDGSPQWSEIEYFISDGRFNVQYFYPDDPSRLEGFVEKRDDLIRRYYGEKPVLYPPWDDDEFPSYEM